MPTTRCCSAFALAIMSVIVGPLVSRLVCASTSIVDSQPTQPTALRLFPVRAAWQLPLNRPLAAPPVFADGRGYFPIAGDQLAAYDIRYGTLLWLVGARPLNRPTVGEGLVFLNERGSLTAFHADTGSVAWRLPWDEPLSAPLVWGNGWLIGTTESGTILAFRAKDGGLIWRQNLSAGIRAPAALAADRVYLPMADGSVIALLVTTGERLWTRRLGGPPNEILALDEELFVGSNDNYLYNIRARDGFVTWRFATGADVVGLPSVDDHHVYFVSMDNVLRCLSRRTGGQQWKRALPLRPLRGPTVAGDMLIISGVSPTPQAYVMKDGRPAGEIAAGGELAAAPHVVTGGPLPMLTIVTRDLAAGTVVRAIVRSIDPTAGAVTPLPNAISPPMPAAPPTPR
jgi:outer membrane protein assembly factor BamB